MSRGLPPRHPYVRLQPQVITQTANEASWSLSQNARAFALLMMAISDALDASQDTKYHYRF
jgi:hypothetical protein